MALGRKIGISAAVIAVAILRNGAARGQLPGTSVQLPTIRVFTVSTTVSVPDRGGAYLGGIGNRASGMTSRGGILGGQSRGASARAVGASVSATIIDHAELEATLLDSWLTDGRLTDGGPPNPPPDAFSLKISAAGASTAGQPAGSVAAIRQRRAAEAEARGVEGADHFAKGIAAHEAGKLGQAKIHFQMAARRLTGELREQCLSRLKVLGAGSAD